MLTFNLKKEWFEKIKSGEKTHEYRIVNHFWKRRIEYVKGGEKIFDEKYADFYITKERGIKGGTIIKFACGYPSKNDKDKYLYAEVKSLTIKNGKDTDLKLDADVYDIEFKLISKCEVEK